jgi:undecaprenyl-diphosphatase
MPLLDRATALAIRFRLNEVGPLLSFLALSLGVWAFVALAGEVREGDTAALDRTILLSLRNPNDLSDPIGPTWLEEAARDITALGGHAVLTIVTLAVLAYLLLTRRRAAALFVLVAVGGGMLLSTGLKLGFERPRPDLVPHGARVYTASFPSGHSMLSAVTYLTLGALLARVEKVWRVRIFLVGLAVALTLLVGVSRVYLGVHWPTDVLAGWCGGGAWASLCWFVALQLQRKGKVEAPGEGAPGGAVTTPR